ncbi:latrophilin-like protein LAT-2 [Anneissia japonica]|uniref:latrophilin-like protein LAT-2 n=1 Tax=Anneissia japonica TaxID=1529436 RepID=UPI00142569E9|nr:latrophilin-like protein LAT-2 [Anneissia japonica]
MEELQILYELEHMLLETEWNSSLETIYDFSTEILNVSLLLISSDSVKTAEDKFKIVSMNEFLFKQVGSYLSENIGIDLTSDHQSVNVQKLSSTTIEIELDVHGGENNGGCSVSFFFTSPSDDFTVLVIIYQDLSLFGGATDIATSTANEKEDSLVFSSGILTITLYNSSLQKIPIPVNFTIQHLENVMEDIRFGGHLTRCTFWHELDKVWSETGCQTVHEQDSLNSTKCVCDHTTSYALLVGNDVISTTNRAISMLTTILCCCSVCCLLMMLLVYVSFEALRNSEKNHIHKNLVVALFLAQLLFLTAVENISSKGVCTFVAIVLHYLYLSVFTWMTIEGLNLYLKIVRVFNSDLLSIRAYMMIGWGVPILIVAIAVTCNIEGYGIINDQNHYICWIDVKSPLLYAFIVPAYIAVLVNTVVSIFVWRIIYLKTDNNNRWKDARSSLKGVIMLSPLLGLPWLFGLFARNSSVSIGTIFTACNAPQGVFLFFTHCLFSNEVRTAMKMHWSKRKARFSVQPQTKCSNVLTSEQNQARTENV